MLERRIMTEGHTKLSCSELKSSAQDRARWRDHSRKLRRIVRLGHIVVEKPVRVKMKAILQMMRQEYEKKLLQARRITVSEFLG